MLQKEKEFFTVKEFAAKLGVYRIRFSGHKFFLSRPSE